MPYPDNRPPALRIVLIYAPQDVRLAGVLRRLVAPPDCALFDCDVDAEPHPPNWVEHMHEQLEAADLAILIYSADVLGDGGADQPVCAALVDRARARHRAGEMEMVAVFARPLLVPQDDPIRACLVPDQPLLAFQPREEGLTQVQARVEQLLRALRREVGARGRDGASAPREPARPELENEQKSGEGNMKAESVLTLRPKSGELLLSRYRLVQRIRHDPWISEWIAADEGHRDGRGVKRTVIVHLFGPRLSGPANDALRERVFRRVGRLDGDGLAGLGKVVEPKAADGSRHFFIVEDAWHRFSSEYGAATSLRAAVVQRNKGVHWIPLLLQIGAQLASLHEPRRDGARVVHGGVRPDNIVVDVSEGPFLVGLNLLAGERVWRPLLEPEPDDFCFLPPGHDIATPAALDASCDVYGFAATVLFAVLDGDVSVTESWSKVCERVEDADLRAALRSALAGGPEASHPSITALCEALRKAYVSIGLQTLPEMMDVPGGETWMGAAVDDTVARPFEKPRRRVRVSSFSMGRGPVPQSLYQLLMGGSPTVRLWPDSAAATSVSFLDSIEFCNRLSRLCGISPAYRVGNDTVSWDRRSEGFRLPTEAEWEYAAAGACAEDEAPRLYPWGDDEPGARACWCGPDHGHFTGNERGPCAAGKHQGGESPFHLRDLAGGVCEWCWDWYRPYEDPPPEKQPLCNPTGPTSCIVPTGYETASYRVVRGGMWTQRVARWLRCSARYIEDQTKRQSEVGFRLARGALPVPPAEDAVVR